jgi:hypothetical protein
MRQRMCEATVVIIMNGGCGTVTQLRGQRRKESLIYGSGVMLITRILMIV